MADHDGTRNGGPMSAEEITALERTITDAMQDAMSHFIGETPTFPIVFDPPRPLVGGRVLLREVHADHIVWQSPAPVPYVSLTVTLDVSVPDSLKTDEVSDA